MGMYQFCGAGSVFVGAPEKLMRKLPGELEQKLEEGCRVIIVGYVPMQWEDEAALPEEIQPLYGVVLEDTIRENTRETLDFLPPGRRGRQGNFRRSCQDGLHDCKAGRTAPVEGCRGFIDARRGH